MICKPVHEWTTRNVVEWMASVNMISYSGHFESTAIQGSDLPGLDRHKLEGMGIKEDYPQEAILVCISELCRTRGISLPASDKDSTCHEVPRDAEKERHDIENLSNNVVNNSIITKDNESNKTSADTITLLSKQPADAKADQQKSSHQLQVAVFGSAEKCDHCQLSLSGSQGLMCRVCGVVSHSICSLTTLPVCISGQIPDEVLQRKLVACERSASIELSEEFSVSDQAAPNFVLACIENIELLAHRERSLDLYSVYSSHQKAADADQLILKLKSKKGGFASDKEYLSGFGVESFAAALKIYLSELSNPLIPVIFYERFLDVARDKNDESCALRLRQLVHQLPATHESTLRALLSHFCRLCKLQFARGFTQPPFELVNAFCYIILRPKWENIVSIVRNTLLHVRICSLLLSRGEWGEPLPQFVVPSLPPAVPPRIMSSHSKSSPDSLATAEWYWGEISRDVCNGKLKDTVDGTFLVRDATSKGSGDYTLTLRQGGCNKLIRILHRDGLYGFSEPLTFPSVVDLIQHFRTNSLAQYNALLNVKLLYPVSRIHEEESSQFDVATVSQMLMKSNREFLLMSRTYDRFHEKNNQLRQEIDLKLRALKSFEGAMKLFDKQIELAKDALEQFPDYQDGLENNLALLNDRKNTLKNEHQNLQSDIKERQNYQRVMEGDMNSLKLEMAQTNKKRDSYQISLIRHGVCKDEIHKLLQESSQLADELKDQCNQTMMWNSARSASGNYYTMTNPTVRDDSSLPHHNESTWLMDCSRSQAEKMLEGKKHGTFLIRKSKTGQFALSLLVVDKVEHILIVKTERGYGFAEPQAVFPTLKSLVLHYYGMSLEDHNSSLRNTTLSYPVLSQEGVVQQHN